MGEEEEHTGRLESLASTDPLRLLRQCTSMGWTGNHGQRRVIDEVDGVLLCVCVCVDVCVCGCVCACVCVCTLVCVCV